MRSSLPTLAVTLLAAVSGWAVAYMSSDGPASGAAPAAGSTRVLPALAVARDREVMSVGLDRLVSGTQVDPVVRDELLRRFEGERDPETLDALAAVISTFPSDEVRALVARLARGDARQRANAFRLLWSAPQAGVEGEASGAGQAAPDAPDAPATVTAAPGGELRVQVFR